MAEFWTMQAPKGMPPFLCARCYERYEEGLLTVTGGTDKATLWGKGCVCDYCGTPYRVYHSGLGPMFHDPRCPFSHGDTSKCTCTKPALFLDRGLMDKEEAMQRFVENNAQPWDRKTGFCCRTCYVCAPTDDITGRCRRHAPAMQGYPVVYLDRDWCGDHKIGSNPAKGALGGK